MNILIIKSDKAKLYPLMFQNYIQSKGFNCFISGSEEKEVYQIIKENNLSFTNTLIYSRTAYPLTSSLFSRLEKKNFRIINSGSVLALTGDKYKTQIFAQSNNIPVADTYKVSKKNLIEITDILKHYQTIVVKPVYSQGGGIFCKKIDVTFSQKEIVRTISDIPGDEIIVQEYIPYQNLIRVIIVGFKALKGATTYDIPKGWKASVCMNPDIKEYGQNEKLEELAEETARVFNTPVSYIDFFESMAGKFILNELNTACSFIIHEKITGVKIHEKISDYLIEQCNFLGKNSV